MAFCLSFFCHLCWKEPLSEACSWDTFKASAMLVIFPARFLLCVFWLKQADKCDWIRVQETCSSPESLQALGLKLRNSKCTHHCLSPLIQPRKMHYEVCGLRSTRVRSSLLPSPEGQPAVSGWESSAPNPCLSQIYIHARKAAHAWFRPRPRTVGLVSHFHDKYFVFPW